MSAAQRVIHHPSELGSLSVLPPRRRIRLEMESLPEDARRNWEKRLNRAYRARGNGEMAVGFVIGLLLCGICLIQAMADRQLGSLGAITAGSALLVPTLAGKLYGLASAQTRLRHLVANFNAQWPETREPD